MIPWQGIVAAEISIRNITLPILMKKISSKHSRTKRFVLQFLFCAILALGAALIFKTFSYSTMAFIMFCTGFCNGFAAFVQWKALKISLSKTSLFTFWDDIIAMALSWIILGETKFFNLSLGIGTALSFFAVILFARHEYLKEREKKTDATGSSPLELYLYIGVYSVIWGVAAFVRNYFAQNHYPGTFMTLNWYTGACVAAGLIFLFYHEPGDAAKTQLPLTRRDISEILLLSGLVMISLLLGYRAYEAAHGLAIVQPIFLVAEMIFPTLIGLFIFHERKQLDSKEWGYLGIGALGGIIIAFSF